MNAHDCLNHPHTESFLFYYYDIKWLLLWHLAATSQTGFSFCRAYSFSLIVMCANHFNCVSISDSTELTLNHTLDKLQCINVYPLPGISFLQVTYQPPIVSSLSIFLQRNLVSLSDQNTIWRIFFCLSVSLVYDLTIWISFLFGCLLVLHSFIAYYFCLPDF